MTMVIAIGGLGGSGTRVIAELFIKSGIYFGDWTRETNDNIAFSALFRGTAVKTDEQASLIQKKIALFIKYMERDHLSFSEALSYLNLSKEAAFFRSANISKKHIFGKVLSKPKQRPLWGWKEPNTHLYLESLFSMISGLKYIHVLRHGLDMAFSKNKSQLNNFGSYYDLSVTGNETSDQLTYLQLEYWIRSTEAFFESQNQQKKETYLLNYNELCAESSNNIKRLMKFCDVSITCQELNFLANLPKETVSNKRYIKYDLGIFDQRQIDFVTQMGFEV
ncbi:sulfotransferase [Roseivirga sp.]|uniref:sulfotransferase n=1 Tax=Roseivirga sp. TaxID=1964215 RepID=UPI003B8DE64E